jgi:hypothetical protein
MKTMPNCFWEEREFYKICGVDFFFKPSHAIGHLTKYVEKWTKKIKKEN